MKDRGWDCISEHRVPGFQACWSFLKIPSLFVLFLRQLRSSKLPKSLQKYLLCLTCKLRGFLHLVWASLWACWNISQSIQVVSFLKVGQSWCLLYRINQIRQSEPNWGFGLCNLCLVYRTIHSVCKITLFMNYFVNKI